MLWQPLEIPQTSLSIRGTLISNPIIQHYQVPSTACSWQPHCQGRFTFQQQTACPAGKAGRKRSPVCVQTCAWASATELLVCSAGNPASHQIRGLVKSDPHFSITSQYSASLPDSVLTTESWILLGFGRHCADLPQTDLPPKSFVFKRITRFNTPPPLSPLPLCSTLLT